MNKTLFLVLVSMVFAMPIANAQTDKSKYCPSVKQVKIKMQPKPWTHMYYAFNDDGKYFYSGDYTEDENNGPAPALMLHEQMTSYNATNKTLSCVYRAYTRMENAFPTLVNIGNY